MASRSFATVWWKQSNPRSPNDSANIRAELQRIRAVASGGYPLTLIQSKAAAENLRTYSVLSLGRNRQSRGTRNKVGGWAVEAGGVQAKTASEKTLI